MTCSTSYCLVTVSKLYGTYICMYVLRQQSGLISKDKNVHTNVKTWKLTKHHDVTCLCYLWPKSAPMVGDKKLDEVIHECAFIKGITWFYVHTEHRSLCLSSLPNSPFLNSWTPKMRAASSSKTSAMHHISKIRIFTNTTIRTPTFTMQCVVSLITHLSE
jgi:hypothetical protein